MSKETEEFSYAVNELKRTVFKVFYKRLRRLRMIHNPRKEMRFKDVVGFLSLSFVLIAMLLYEIMAKFTLEWYH